MSIRAPICFLLLTLTAGCGAKMAPETPATVGSGGIAATGSGGAAAVERAVIRSGDLSLQVRDVDATRLAIDQIVEDVGGLVSRWSLSDRYLAMTVRVPEPRLDSSMERVAELGKVVHRSLTSRDVTEELIDLEARLRNLQALRDRLRSYLQQAGKLDEILAVERELARVQIEIEQIEGRLKLLRGQVEMSELSIEARQKRSR